MAILVGGCIVMAAMVGCPTSWRQLVVMAIPTLHIQVEKEESDPRRHRMVVEDLHMGSHLRLQAFLQEQHLIRRYEPSK